MKIYDEYVLMTLAEWEDVKAKATESTVTEENAQYHGKPISVYPLINLVVVGTIPAPRLQGVLVHNHETVESEFRDRSYNIGSYPALKGGSNASLLPPGA
jgi:hypothetical protein